MPRKTSLSSVRKNSERGFSFPEVIISVTILAIVTAVVFSSIVMFLRNQEKLSSRLRTNSQLIALDKYIRKVAAQVRFPFWSPEVDFEATDSSFTVPYVDGLDYKKLRLEFADSYLKTSVISEGEAETETREFIFGPFTGTSVTLEQNADFLGLKLDITLLNDQLVTILADFGGTPLLEDGETR